MTDITHFTLLVSLKNALADGKLKITVFLINLTTREVIDLKSSFLWATKYFLLEITGEKKYLQNILQLENPQRLQN